MKPSVSVSVYSVTLLLSAALLFSVQPMFSKMILPMLGGTPQVWNTAMLFFQVLLLAGYAYAHVTSAFLGIRAQAVLHIALLALFTVVLPIALPAGWHPPTDKSPALWQLSVMTAVVGGPFFVLAGSAPMLQRWFAASGHRDADNPYFLYGASNLGSMTALLAYPVIIEPLLTLSGQSQVWAGSYWALIACTAASAFLVWKAVPKTRRVKTVKHAHVTWRQRGLWTLLAFVPSSLMLGVTTFITTDIASVPMLWILPLALYVGTFIIAFARKPVLDLRTALMLQAVAIIMLFAHKTGMPIISTSILILLHLSVFFFSALVCHMELARTRPAASNLTEFYLFMSIGGALGGFFNAIIAPVFFVIPLEYGLALALACFMRYITEPQQSFAVQFDLLRKAWKNKKKRKALMVPSGLAALTVALALMAFFTSLPFIHFAVAAGIASCLAYLMDRRWVFGGLAVVLLAFFPFGYLLASGHFTKVIHQERNYFGVLKIADTAKGNRILLNGTTTHGTQALDGSNKLEAIAYYSAISGLADMFRYLDQRGGKQEIGVIGLGVGTVACYNKPRRHFDFYEINPAVKDIAENPDYFTFLKNCKSPYDIIMGDGRLTLQAQEDGKYDMLLVDAFTSDNIPVHLLTIEAINLYLQKLKKNGILIVHISNRHLDLEPVLHEAGLAVGIPTFARSSGGDRNGLESNSYSSHWVAFLKDRPAQTFALGRKWSETLARPGVRLWTDQFSNILSVLGNKSDARRTSEDVKKK